MADINGVNQSANLFSQINQQNQDSSTTAADSAAADSSKMFMELMIAQLKNQSPTSPADTNDFMQQISSMSSVESITNLSTTMEQLSSSLMTSQTALQASSMVGQKAFVSTDTGVLSESGPVQGVVSLPTSASDVRVSVYDGAGTLVDTVQMGAKAAGDHNFEWQGGDLPAGDYRLVAEAQTGDVYEVAQSFIGYTVNSVTLGQNGIGMAINTDAGSVGINDVKQLGKG
ncbi:MAG: flagellar hook capping FlgD N-terminal domain-containing protein [Pontibacterium sp.]